MNAMLDRRALLLLPAFALAACVPDGHGVPQDTVHQFHVANVELRGGAAIYSWPVQERLAIAQGKLSPDEQKELTGRGAGTFTALREQMEKAMQAQFSAQVNNLLGPQLRGPKAATLVITVRHFDIPSLARKVIVGGNAGWMFDIDLVDKASGTAVVRYTGRPNQNYQLQGLASIAEAAVQGDANDPAGNMIRNEVTQYRDWLLATQH